MSTPSPPPRHPVLTERGSPQRLNPLGQTPSDGWPLFDSASCKAHEVATSAGLAPHTLMQRAGASVARLALAVAPHSQRTVIVAGRGNNGGDGLEAALHLHLAGRSVQVQLLDGTKPLPADAAASLERARQAGVRIEPWTTDTHSRWNPDLVIDAVLGRGLGTNVTGPPAQAIRDVCATRAPVLSIDLPSGLPADTGMPTHEGTNSHPCAGDFAMVKATWTLAMLSLAPGLFTGQGREATGSVWWDDLQAPQTSAPVAKLIHDSVARRLRPTSPHHLHKGSRGDVVIIGGATGMAGAAWLAARRALHSGAGRVYVHLLDPNTPDTDPTQPELMVRRRFDDLTLDTGTVVAGCGGGEAISAQLPILLAHSLRLVLDADALNAVARHPSLQVLLKQRVASGRATILTPHPLEAARLLKCTASAVQANRLRSAQELAEQMGAVAVLKGSGSIIACPQETPWINPTGNAALATPGSGDVLAGWIGATWSRLACSPPENALPPTPTAWHAAAVAVFDHGLTAERLRPDGEPLPAGMLASAPKS